MVRTGAVSMLRGAVTQVNGNGHGNGNGKTAVKMFG
jgi:hypothetical protein